MRCGFSPAAHGLATLVLSTCVHLYCALARRKQNKNNVPTLAREIGKKSARRGFPLTAHGLATLVLNTCVHLYCAWARRKQHKSNVLTLARELGKKIRAARISSGRPRARYASAMYVCALVMCIGKA